MKKFTMKSTCLTMLVLSLVLALQLPAYSAEPVKWKAAMGMSYAKGYAPVEKFLRAVEKAMDGQLVIQDFQPGEHPYGPGDVPKAIQKGVMQIGLSLSLYTQSVIPQMGLQDLPFLFSSPEEFLSMMDDPEYKDVHDYILGAPLKKWNQIPIAWFAYGGYMFAGPKWVDNFDSWEGLRIRVYSKPMAEMVKLFGAVPVNVTWSEVYTALQRKMIDGFITATAGAYPAKLYESTKWVTNNDWSVGLHWLSVNKNAFDELPADMQQKFMAACKENAKILQEDYFMEDARAIKLAMKNNGVKFKYMDPAFKAEVRQKVQPQWEEFWAKKVGPEASAMVKRINDYHQKYMENKK